MNFFYRIHGVVISFGFLFFKSIPSITGAQQTQETADSHCRKSFNCFSSFFNFIFRIILCNGVLHNNKRKASNSRFTTNLSAKSYKCTICNASKQVHALRTLYSLFFVCCHASYRRNVTFCAVKRRNSSAKCTLFGCFLSLSLFF